MAAKKERTERLDKVVSRVLGCSRSAATALIKQGEVAVNGVDKRDPQERIALSGDLYFQEWPHDIAAAFAPRIVMLNKPQGYICADSDRHSPVVLSLLDLPRLDEVHCVGRLDLDTEGLLLLTDDGELNHRLCSPKYAVPKTYRALLRDPPQSSYVTAFAKGLWHAGEKKRYHSARLELRGGHEVEVTLTEGRYHEVKRMFECVDNEVTALRRISFGPLSLDPALESGQWRLLTFEESELLRGCCGYRHDDEDIPF
ncbi:MAG: rRNA pseudouridine synthase [Succinivibrio sp.]|nr:rRNA pseudouridine synthase [Succinivibrio sp.]